MTRLPKSITLAAAALAASVTFAACGEQKIEVSKSDTSEYRAATLFKERCAGCHTFKQAGTHGSAANIRTRERTDGPNFNVRHECTQRVLYAIQNGGFSGAIMPGNIIVGEDARLVAEFVAKYAGLEAGPRAEGTGDASNGYSCQSLREDTGDDVGQEAQDNTDSTGSNDTGSSDQSSDSGN